VSEQIRQIAERIRELRRISGLSQEALAEEFHLPLETYQGYESGQADMPVSFLYEIANRFQVELTTILTGKDPKLHTYCIVRKDRGVRVERRKQYDYQSLAYNFAHKKAEPFLVSVDPQPEDAPIDFNTHPGQEFNYVLEGVLQVIINGHPLVLEEGDSLFFDSSAPHGMKALKGKQARFLAVIF
jgi:transcriptional regulator with XRE-family HTH domain